MPWCSTWPSTWPSPNSACGASFTRPARCAIAATVEKPRTTQAVTTVDRSAVDYAESHSVGELRSWLRRLRARLEPDAVRTETARAIDERRVSVTHHDDGTSWLNTLLPTGVAVALADLIGLTDGPGLTLDGEPVGAEWVRELAQSEHTIFRRLVLDPAGQVLDTTVIEYRPTESDLDHELAYDPGGTTSADNLRCLCRRHHHMKSHRHLDERHLARPMPHVERYTA